MEYEYELNETQAQPVLSMRIITSTHNLIPDLKENFIKILDYLNKLGKKPTGSPYAAYYNWEKDRLDVELGFPVDEVVAGNDNIVANQIPAGKKASTYYKGRLQKIAPAYKGLTNFIKEKGYVSGINYEFYENLLDQVSEEELVTKIMYIVK